MTTPTVSKLSGTGYRQIKSPTMTPQQSELLSQLIGGLQPGVGRGLSHLGNLAGGSEESFKQLEAPALREFNELMGGLSSRFSGMGGSGARKSSGFQNYGGQAAANLAEDLQAQRLNMQHQAIQELLGLSESLLGKPTFQTGFIPRKQKKPSFWQSLMGGLSGGLGSLSSLFL